MNGLTQSAILSGAVWSASRSFASFSPRAMCGNANAGPLLWLELGSEAIRPGERKDVRRRFTAQWQCGPLFRYQRGAAIEQAQPAAEKCAQESKPAARGALKVSEIAAATQSPTTTPARGIATSWSLGSVTSIAIASMLPATAAAMSIASPTRWKKAIRAELDAALTGAVDAFTPERLAAPRRSLSALGQTRGVTATRRRQERSIARVISG